MKSLVVFLSAIAAHASANTMVLLAKPTALSVQVSGTFSTLGTDRIAALGSLSLTNLSAKNLQGAFLFVESPRILEPLLVEVAARYTEESFVALTPDEKLVALKEAAVAAEAKAEALATKAVAVVADVALEETPVGSVAWEQFDAHVQAAEEVATYLPRSRLSQVAVARHALKSFAVQRAALKAAFMEKLPSRISAGEFTPQNLLHKKSDGWHAADENPDVRYESLKEFYLKRFDSMFITPLGPWSVGEARLIRETLERPEIVAEIKAEGHSDSLIKMRAAAKEMQDDASLWYEKNPEFSAALGRSAAGSAEAADIEAVEKFYTQALENTSVPWTGQARIIATIRDGGDWRAPWATIQARRAQLVEKTSYGTVGGVFSGILAAITATSLAVQGNPLWAALFTIVGVSAFIWMAISIRRLLNLEERGGITATLRRYFPSDKL
jgi:hypothetical protein